ncbi:DUF3987 domain-containing protein [Gloeothece verrucosa]|uniref:DUF3987 domain-containing protein n=1 Tax=Gloeothece verrucosa (strain PCC 7822) TaxID=497965 RepID=E0UJ72_GLOV7|nr:DUF3987 domain-containing protein [Gloeothece verrucosa]ADN15775.1 hypothetical protein Cyan7822_3843 [Gloeothece verrucosa PCC 7822]
MIDRTLFNHILNGWLEDEKVLAYYNALVSFIEKNPDHSDTKTAIEHRIFIEDCYPALLPQKPQESKPDNTSKEMSEELKQKIDELIDNDYDPVAIMPVLKETASKYGWNLYELNKYYDLRKRWKEDDDFREEVEAEVNEVVRMSNQNLNLEHFFNEEIAKPLKLFSDNLQVRHPITLTTALVGTSVCHQVGSRLLVDASKGWLEPPGLYGLLVSPSGQGKSPIQYALIQRPFWEIQSEWKKIFDQNRKEYYEQLEELKALPKEERQGAMKELEEPPNQPRILFASDPTVIGINGQFEAYPKQALLGLYDEAKKLFAFDRTSSGKSDQADILSYYNGFGVVELRKDGIRANVGECIFSILGLIQPDVLLELMSDLADPDGKWARFIFCIQPLEKKRATRNGPAIDIHDLITSIYRHILKQPATKYLLDTDAQEIFDRYLYEEIEPKRICSTSPGLQSMYGKTGGQVARLALNLHVFNWASKLMPIPDIITGKTMFQAIMLNRFYVSQVKLLHAQAQVHHSEEIAAKLAMILQIAKNKGSVTARDVQKACRAFRKIDTAQIREWFRKLELMGKAVCRGSGNRLKLTPLL